MEIEWHVGGPGMRGGDASIYLDPDYYKQPHETRPSQFGHTASVCPWVIAHFNERGLFLEIEILDADAVFPPALQPHIESGSERWELSSEIVKIDEAENTATFCFGKPTSSVMEELMGPWRVISEAPLPGYRVELVFASYPPTLVELTLHPATALPPNLLATARRTG